MQAEKDPKRNHKKKTKTKTFWPAADFKMKTGPKFFRLHFLRRFSCKKEPQIVRNFFRLRRAENPMKCSGEGGGLSSPSPRSKIAPHFRAQVDKLRNDLKNRLFSFSS